MQKMPAECIDLVYTDPPFFTKRKYKDIHQTRGFDDSREYFESQSKTGAKGLNAYMEWLEIRLREMHRLLKPTGSFYLHLDWHAVHYAKVMCDKIFGYNNFKNEIIWKRKHGGMCSGKYRRYGTATDSILFYTKSGQNKKGYTYNQQFLELQGKQLKKYKYDDKDGRGPYCLNKIISPSFGKHGQYTYKGRKPHPNGWSLKLETMQRYESEGILHFPEDKNRQIKKKTYLNTHKGIPINNLWTDISIVSGNAKDKVRYPTQKPVALLERIVLTSSNEGDTVFDPFMGCGTAMVAAKKLGRKYQGIDINPEAMRLAQQRLDKILPVKRPT